jgi:hypothetical protein
VVHLGLGNALQRLGRLAEAREQFSRVIAMAPDQAAGHCNLGNALMAMGRYQDAIAAYRQALQLDSLVRPLLHTNLAQALLVSGDHEGAEAESRRALALNPDFADAHGYLAEALHKQGRFAEAVPHYRRHGTAESAAKGLEDLYRLGDMEAFAAGQKELHESQPDNLRLAAISVMASLQHGPQYASRFCADPLRYVGISSLKAKLAPFPEFADALLKEAGALDSVWEPPAKTTRGGFQTEGNLFDIGAPAIARLRQAIGESVEAYFRAHEGAADRFVTHRPNAPGLTGWIVRLQRQGRQDMHIHPDGWLSGVLYLRLPPMPAGEGGVGFSLAPGRSDLLHQPREGDLVLFPSSLFHFTVPFSAESERISIAFDLLPRG